MIDALPSNFFQALSRTVKDAVAYCFRQLISDYGKAYLSRKEAARMLGVSESFLEKLADKGEGPPFRKLGRIVRYARTDITHWVESHPVETSDLNPGPSGKS